MTEDVIQDDLSPDKERFRDPAGDMARKIQREQEEGLRESFERDPEEVTEVKKTSKLLFQKTEYRWKPEDQRVLVQLRASAEGMVKDVFAEAQSLLDDLYASLRVPELNHYGIVKKDMDGRVVWKKDAQGRVLEEWSNLTGQDLEQAIFGLMRVKMDVSMRVNELFQEAIFAKHSFNDDWHDAYSSLIEGTIGDREAVAARKTRETKYSAYFRYYLWSVCNTFLEEIKDFLRLMERVRAWRIRAEEGPSSFQR